MRPEYVRAVDPIFLASLQFLGRIERSERTIPSDERAMLLRKIDEAESMLGNTQEWRLAKYALCCWIDSQLIQAPWQGSRWWIDNCLEEKYFGHRLAHVEFFAKASEAAQLPRKDSLEVFYLAVVLGFRGFYADTDAAYTAASLKIPDTVDSWCRAVAMSLQLRQGRPPIDDSVYPGDGAAPLTGRTALMNMSLISTVLVALAIAYFLLFFKVSESSQADRTELRSRVAANGSEFKIIK